MTAGYAIRYADELNYVFLSRRRDRRADGRRPRSAARPRAATRRRCASRCTPATRRCATPARPGSTRSAGFAAIGLDRIVCFPTRWSPTLEAQAAFAEDCRAAGVGWQLAVERRPVAPSTGRAIRPSRSQRRVAEPGAPDEQLDRDRAVAARVDRLAEAGARRSASGVASRQQPRLVVGELEVAVGERRRDRPGRPRRA